MGGYLYSLPNSVLGKRRHFWRNQLVTLPRVCVANDNLQSLDSSSPTTIDSWRWGEFWACGSSQFSTVLSTMRFCTRHLIPVSRTNHVLSTGSEAMYIFFSSCLNAKRKELVHRCYGLGYEKGPP